MMMIDNDNDETITYSRKRQWWLKASLIVLGLCLLGVIIYFTVGGGLFSKSLAENIVSPSKPSEPVSSSSKTSKSSNESPRLESISKNSWEKLYSKGSAIPKVPFLNSMKKRLRSASIEQGGYELTSDRNLLNNPSRLRHLTKKVKRIVVNGEEIIEEPNYQFIVKLKDGASASENSKSFIRENNVLTSNTFSIVTTASHVKEIIKTNEIDWIGEYESSFKSTLDFQKLQTTAIELKRNPANKRSTIPSFKNIGYNSTRISQKIDQSKMIHVMISVIPSIQSITSGSQRQETETLANDINSILTKKYVKDVDFSPMTVSTESICEIAFTPLIATYVGYLLASHPNVHFIHRKLALSISNKYSQHIIQSSHPSLPNETPFYKLGIYGTDQVVAIADTGLDWDHCFFSDKNRPASPTGVSVNLSRRKIIKIRTTYSQDSTDVSHGHGTHVVGSAVGSMEDTVLGSGVNAYHGVAPQAKVYFTDFAPADGSRLNIPNDMNDLLNPPYTSTSNLRVFSNSWGCSIGAYVDCSYDCTGCTLTSAVAPHKAGTEVTNADCKTLFGVDTCCSVCDTYETYAQGFDNFIWSHQDATIFIAQGNDGQISRFGNIGTPATSKNGISVGASGTSNAGFIESASYEETGAASLFLTPYLQGPEIYNENNLAAFSSRGPAIGGRIKPDFVAPGWKIVSANSDGSVSTKQCGTGSPSVSSSAALLTKSGTSMATPIAAGGALLLREYFIKHRSIANPSGHLIKAAMIHSSVPLNGSVAYSTLEQNRFSISEAFGSPNFYDGFGKIQLGSLLTDEHGRKVTLDIAQNSFTASNQVLRLCYRLKKNIASTSSFRATLAWYDYSTSTSVLPDLINNLDLIVNSYVWNSESNTYSSFQVLYGNGGSSIDTKNNVERVTIPSITNVEDSNSYVMISVQTSNGGITGGSQPFTLLSSFVEGYWETLLTSDCMFEEVPPVVPQPTPTINSSISDNSTVSIDNNSTSITQNSTTTDVTNSTILDNSTTLSDNSTSYNSTDNNSTIISNSTITQNSTIISNTTDTTNSTNFFNNTGTENATVTHTSQNSTDITNSTISDNSTISTSNNVTSDNSIGNSTAILDNSTAITQNSTTDVTNSTILDNSTTLSDNSTSYNSTSDNNSTIISNSTTISDNSTTDVTNSTYGFNETETGTNATTRCYGYANTSRHVCSSNGLCVGENNCSCYDGYYGDDCKYPICFGIYNQTDSCSGKGYCENVNKCRCDSGFTGEDCSIMTCNDKSEAEGGCSYHGYCIDHVCACDGNFEGVSCSDCKLGFNGTNCDIPVCSGLLATDSAVCSYHGSCAILNSSTPECHCKDGYSGLNCEFTTCNGINSSSLSDVCSGRGRCVDVDSCQCNGNFNPQQFCSSCLPDFAGTHCNHSVCFDNTTCNSHGTCNIEAECECFGNWTGSYCDHCIDGIVGTDCNIECLARSTCNNRGTCNEDGSCSCIPHAIGDRCSKCESGWYGSDCSFGIDSSSFGFSSNVNVIYGKIQSNYSQQISCNKLIVDLSKFGTGPVCVLNGTKSTFQITLGSSATINIGDTISLRTYLDSPDYIQVNVSRKDYIITPPIASLTSDKSSIGIGCGTVTLDASSSSSTDGRKIYYSWSTISAPSENSRLTLNNLITTSTSSGVTFSPDTLASGTYKVQVKITSSFSRNYSTAAVSLVITERELPQITIREGLESSFTIGSTSMITPVISFPKCWDTSQTVTYVYKLNTTMSAASVTLKQDDQYLVFSDSFTKITIEGDYYFTLYAANVSISFKITAKASPLKVSFNIGDMSQSYQDPVNFKIYLQDPSDSTGTTGSLAITCNDDNTSGTCDGFSSSTHKFAASVAFNRTMQPGNYYFTATFSKGIRKTSASLTIKVLNVSKSTILRVMIVPPSSVSTSVVDPTSDLILEASSKDTLSASRVYTWSSSNLALSTTSNKYLIVSKSLLSPGTTYTVMLRITDGSKSGSTSLTFTTNSPPTGGTFTVLPSQGVTLQDLFEIKCGSGWTDSHLPLSYKFLSKIKGSDSDWKVLSPTSEKNTISIYLPVGYWQIKAQVSDYYGATTESISEVNVTKPQDVAATIQSLKTIEKGTLSVSTVSSVLGLITSISTQSSQQQASELSQSGTTFIEKFFEQIESEESLTSVTAASVSSTISVVSSITSAISYLEDNAVSYGINKFLSSITKVNEKDSVIMQSADVDASIKSADAFKTYISSKISTTRSQTSFTSSDLKNIETIYENLVDIKIKTLVADMAAVRVTGVNSYRYARLVSTLTLNGLSENITQTITQPFALSSTFSSLNELQGVESVVVSLKSSKVSNSSLSLATKALEFNILVSNTATTIASSANVIASLSLERVSSTSVRAGSTVLECRVETSTGVFSKTQNCAIVSTSSAAVTVSVKSTGIYVIISSQDNQESTPTTPTPGTDGSTSDLDITYIIVAASIIVVVILVSIISIGVVFCVLSRLLKRKKRRSVINNNNQQLQLRTMDISKFHNAPQPSSSTFTYNDNNSQMRLT